MSEEAKMEGPEAICECYTLELPEEEYCLTIRVQEDGSGRIHCDECGRPMSPLGMSRTAYLQGQSQ